MKNKAETLEQADQIFTNEKIKFKVHSKPLCQVELEVEANGALTKEAHQQAVKVVKKHVTIDGFRKGKAPDELIIKKVPQQIDPEWKKSIAHLAFEESRKLVQIPVLNNEMNISYTVHEHSENGAKLSLVFETEPSVPHVDPKTIFLKKISAIAVDEEKIQETVRQTLLFFTEWKQIYDRTVQENDFVILDVDIIDQTPEERLFTNVRFEVTDRSMAQWMQKLIIGKNAGEVLEGTSVPDSDASDEDQKTFKPRQVRIHIKQIETTTIPELTPQLLHQLGVSSKEELLKNIEKILNDKANTSVREQQREAVNEALLTQYSFDIPLSIVNREVRFRLEQLLKDEEYLAHWNKLTPEAKKRAVSAIEEQSKKAVQIFYLCRKILSDAKLSLTSQDIEKPDPTPLHLLLDHSPEESSSSQEEAQPTAKFARSLLEKAQNYIIEHATYT